MSTLTTRRLQLVPISLELVEAVMADRRDDVERLAGARLPGKWPGRALIERAFCASLERIRANPGLRLWGDRLMLAHEDNEARIVGSVVFHGAPDAHGAVEIGYGVEQSSQGKGYGSEATLAMVEWALAQEGCEAVTATTLPWHTASVRILERAGLSAVGWREHEVLGDLRLFERRRGDAHARLSHRPNTLARAAG
ncbi:MAG: GNAT family N-acetyltransferase [Myxococcales bacterium]|nr:GNAT family N-acetyltransferase [Myxococcales bacterium]